MIHYDLRCGAGHEFDGWFKDSAAFDSQAAAGQLSCPFCGNTEVRKGVMAPAIARSGGRTTMPQIFIDGQAIGGSDDLTALERAGRLDPLLAA